MPGRFSFLSKQWPAMRRPKNTQLDDLVTLAQHLGIVECNLQPLVHRLCLGSITPDLDFILHKQLLEQAEQVNGGGLRAQLAYLLDALGARATVKTMTGLTNPLETFVRRSTSAVDDPDPTADELRRLDEEAEL